MFCSNGLEWVMDCSCRKSGNVLVINIIIKTDFIFSWVYNSKYQVNGFRYANKRCTVLSWSGRYCIAYLLGITSLLDQKIFIKWKIQSYKFFPETSLHYNAILREDVSHATFKQDRQCAYNVTLRRVHETIFAVEKQEVLHISLCV